MSARVETGPIRFGDDWAGVFLRGDAAMSRVVNLRTSARLLRNAGYWINAGELEGLAALLASCQEPCTARQFPAAGENPK